MRTFVVATSLTLLSLAGFEVVKTIMKEEYAYWGPRLAKQLLRLAGLVAPSRRLEMLEHLETIQADKDIPGVVFALEALVRSPLVVISDMRSAICRGLVAWRLRLMDRRDQTGAPRIETSTRRVAAIVARYHVSPYLLIVPAGVSFLLAAPLILAHRPAIAAAILSIGAVFEAFDGAAARKSAESRRAIFCDYLMDRASEVILFAALAFRYRNEDVIIALLALSILVVAQFGTYVGSHLAVLRLDPRSSLFVPRWRIPAVIVGLWSAALFGEALAMRTCLLAAAAMTLWYLSEQIAYVLSRANVNEAAIEARLEWVRVLMSREDVRA